MAHYLPVTLSGANLGQRHCYLNSRVHQAASELVSWPDIEDLPEQTPVDRLFKIDLANKLKNVDYILKNLKDDDMLYVSRALKCKWLVERCDIINPKYLEDLLFPEMVMPAITKLKHWLYINLRDPSRCEQFYEYYKKSKFDLAMKFLSHCSNKFIFKEFPEILTKISPHHLKVLGEKDPKLVKIFFDSLATNNDLVKVYLEHETDFYKSLKCVLKTDPDIFLDIIEKHHNIQPSCILSPSATDYIMRFHKKRFMAKPELYVVYFLHMPTLARCLSDEECQDLVIKLARADYISWWFSYAAVEPLVKRMNRDKRAAFKKLVFVEKKVGDRVAKWPYVLPAPPVLEDTSSAMFYDQDYEPIQMQRQYYEVARCMGGMKLMKRCLRSERCAIMPIKSELQRLFDEFRFRGFEPTLHELTTRIRTAKSADRRRDMLLVLVSKSGGRADAVRELLQLALKLRNEPVHERAAVVRSLVKRASAWRLPQDVWDTMLEYARGLGLDGSEPEAECREGLHAVVLRRLLATGDCEAAVRVTFLNHFSTLAEYKLGSSERPTIAAALQRILATAAANGEPEAAAGYLDQLLDVIKQYHIPIQTSQAVPAVVGLAERDAKIARPLIERLYEARVGRRELLRQCLEFRRDDAALLNALRHDPDAIRPNWLVQLLTDGKTGANQYLLKLAVYYSETGGIRETIRQSLQNNVIQKPDVTLARPLAILAGSDISSIWHEEDLRGNKHRKLAAALRANMHRARPAPDALALGWRKAGMKAVAWRAMRCRPNQVKQLAQDLLEERVKRTVRLALILAQRTDCAVDLFSTAVAIRPQAALRAAVLYFRSLGDAGDLRLWNIVKPVLSGLDLARREGLRQIFRNIEWVPKTIKPEFCAVLYLTVNKVPDYNADNIRVDLMKCLAEIDNTLFDNVMLQILENIDNKNPTSYPAIVIRYLMLSKSNDELKTRFEKIGDPFLEKVYGFHNAKTELQREFFRNNVDQLMSSLQYNSAFLDVAYQYCMPVIEKVKIWMEKFLPKEMYFEQYCKIHATMLYYKAIRQCIKQRPEVFGDPVKKITEGIKTIGHTFGRYLVKELLEMKSKYFDSVVELYGQALVEYLRDDLVHDNEEGIFVANVIKGMLSESVGDEARLTIQVLQRQYFMKSSLREEILEMMSKSDIKEMQFFTHAEIYA